MGQAKVQVVGMGQAKVQVMGMGQAKVQIKSHYGMLDGI
jgi:hypothetical protein